MYTKYPLTIGEFNQLVANISAKAANCPENVHLCLASIPVFINDEIANTVLYTECGPKPRLHCFSKRIASTTDPTYNGTQHYRHPAFAFKETEIPKLTTLVSADGSIPVSHESVFKVRLSGGAEFLITTDICMEHAYATTHHTLREYLSQKRSGEMLPSSINHLVISNSILLASQRTYGTQVTHVDFYKDLAKTYSRNFWGLYATGEKDFSLIAPCIKNLRARFPTTSFSIEAGKLKVSNNSFGGEYRVKLCEKSQMTADNTYRKIIHEINHENIRKTFITAKAQNEADRIFLKLLLNPDTVQQFHMGVVNFFCSIKKVFSPQKVTKDPELWDPPPPPESTPKNCQLN